MIVVIVIAVTCRRRHRNRPKEQPDVDVCSDNPDNPGSVELYEDDKYYSAITEPAAQANNNALYTRPLPAQPDHNESEEYSTLDSVNSVEPDPSDNDTPYYLTLQADDECIITPC